VSKENENEFEPELFSGIDKEMAHSLKETLIA